MTSRSVEFFEKQFARQAADRDFALNPFERVVLPYLSGDVLDLGCGLGNLAVAAARNGCNVTAVDASATAVASLTARAAAQKLPIKVRAADLREIEVAGEFDCAISIGLLMFLPPESARAGVSRIQRLVKPGGLAAINVLIEGTTFTDMFDPSGYCLFGEDELPEAFRGWTTEFLKVESFPALRDTVKRFCTIVARRRNA
ncbi:MAG: methyltransferase domain-containing protein [Acidobacteriota bacterium]|nr:methyltransferase domain-containing protein [Acidobacteriota bacterium]